MIPPLSLVKMSEELKLLLRGKCGVAGHHLGPFDGEPEAQCYSCSSDHVEEFGECIGVVIGSAWEDPSSGPEVDVRWQPSNLKYCYDPKYLIEVES
jgi:hypothetical protein